MYIERRKRQFENDLRKKTEIENPFITRNLHLQGRENTFEPQNCCISLCGQVNCSHNSKFVLFH